MRLLKRQIPSSSCKIFQAVLWKRIHQKEELRLTIDILKKGRAANDIPMEYIQAAAENDNFLNEMVKLNEEIWQTHSIPVMGAL